MNASVLLLAGALALAAPVGYFTYETATAAPGQLAEVASEIAVAASAPNLLVRFHHDGDAIDVALALSDGTDLALTLEEGDEVVELAVDPTIEHTVDVSLAVESWEPLGLFGNAFSGSAKASFAECDVVELLFQTLARDGNSGISVLGAECVPGPMRHVAVETSGPAVAFPYPTCPLQCTVGYGFGSSGRLEFEVPEGATRIDVIAHWTAAGPFTEALSIWLTTPDDECGEGCWVAVATGEGVEQVSFSYDAPAPGAYGVSSHFTMPAGVSVRQDVWLEAVVHTS